VILANYPPNVRVSPKTTIAQEQYRQLDQRIDLPETEISLPVSHIHEGITLQWSL